MLRWSIESKLVQIVQLVLRKVQFRSKNLKRDAKIDTITRFQLSGLRVVPKRWTRVALTPAYSVWCVDCFELKIEEVRPCR